MTIYPLFWRVRRVLCTGHIGFKCAWLLYWLRLLDAEACGCLLSFEESPNLLRDLF